MSDIVSRYDFGLRDQHWGIGTRYKHLMTVSYLVNATRCLEHIRMLDLGYSCYVTHLAGSFNCLNTLRLRELP